MKRVLVYVAVTLLVICMAMAMPCAAQDVSNLYMAGGSYSPGAQPSVAGSALYAHQINSNGTYAFSAVDALPASVKPFTVTTSVGVGIAQRIATIGKVNIFAPTEAGVAWTGQSVGWSWDFGLGAPFQINAKNNLWLMPTVRVKKASVGGGSYQPIIGVLFGWGK